MGLLMMMMTKKEAINYEALATAKTGLATVADCALGANFLGALGFSASAPSISEALQCDGHALRSLLYPRYELPEAGVAMVETLVPCSSWGNERLVASQCYGAFKVVASHIKSRLSLKGKRSFLWLSDGGETV
jgi:hypothetical protein